MSESFLEKQKIDPVKYQIESSKHKQKKSLNEFVLPQLVRIQIESNKIGEKSAEQLLNHNKRYDDSVKNGILNKIISGKLKEISNKEFEILKKESPKIYRYSNFKQFLKDEAFFKRVEDSITASSEVLIGEINSSLKDLQETICSKKNSIYSGKTDEEKTKIVKNSQEQIIENVRKSNKELEVVYGKNYSDKIEEGLKKLEQEFELNFKKQGLKIETNPVLNVIMSKTEDYKFFRRDSISTKTRADNLQFSFCGKVYCLPIKDGVPNGNIFDNDKKEEMSQREQIGLLQKMQKSQNIRPSATPTVKSHSRSSSTQLQLK